MEFVPQNKAEILNMPQLPYAIVAAAVSFVSYIIAGFVQNAWLCLPIAIILMLAVLFLLKNVHSQSME